MIHKITNFCFVGLFVFGAIFSVSMFADVPAELSTAQSDFPSSLGYTLRQDVNNRSGVPVDKLEIVKATHETWPDGCLGLGTSDELCAQMIVDGWHVVISDGKQFWGYRADNNGQVFRAEPTN